MNILLVKAKRYNVLLTEHYRQGSVEAAKVFEGKKLAEWTEVEGIKVLRVADSNYVGVPVTGRRNSKWFEIIDLNDRSDIICQVTNREIHTWLFRKGN
jgi:hypothetical protein